MTRALRLFYTTTCHCQGCMWEKGEKGVLLVKKTWQREQPDIAHCWSLLMEIVSFFIPFIIHIVSIIVLFLFSLLF